MATYHLVRKDPDKGYFGRQLWLPKNQINTRAMKAGLEFPIVDDQGMSYLQLWFDDGDHLIVPREFLNREEYAHLDFPIIAAGPTRFPHINFKSNVVLDFLEPEKTTQHDAFADMLNATGGLLNLACGKGKTIIALHYIAHQKIPALVVVNNTTLIDQWRERIEEFLDVPGGVGVIQGPPDTWDWEGRGICLAMIHSLALRHEELPQDMDRYFGLVIYDECFVAGTPVDGVPIEKRKVGDLIWSFDEHSGHFQRQPIERIYVSRPQTLISVFIAGEEFTCTAAHPFWTNRGWVPAALLTSTDMVLCFTHEQEHLRVWNPDSGERDRQVLSRLQTEAVGGTQKGILDSMCGLWGHRTGAWEATPRSIPANGTSLLLTGVHEHLDFGRKLQEDAYNQFTQISYPFREDARAEPYARPKSESEAESVTACDGLEASDTRRQREASTSPTATAGLCIRLGDGSSHSHRARGKETRTAKPLQDRHREPRSYDSRRSGRTIPPGPRPPRSGPKERSIPSWARVDGVEIHEQTSDRTFGGRCPDGLVYNLQVRGTPAYNVGAINAVVHNCHHLSAPLFSQTAPLFYGERHGLTATVNREDGLESVYQYHVGEIYHRNLTQDMKPRIYFQQCPIRIDTRDPVVREAVYDKAGRLSIPKLRNYLGALPECNDFIATKITKPLEADRKVLALSHSVQQLRNLNEMFEDSGLCTGREKPAARLVTLRTKQLSFGTLQLVKEALDEATLDTLFFLTPFGSSAIEEGGFNTLQQGMGRIQRFKEAKKTPVVVILDHIYIPKLHRMCSTLKKQLKNWPEEQGGPLEFQVLRPYSEEVIHE